MKRHAKNPALADAKRLPGLLEAAREANDEAAYERARRLVRATLATHPASGRQGQPEGIRLETYYALIMLDGDHMGAILSGMGADNDKTAITYRESLHPQVQSGFDQHAASQPLIQAYGRQKRPISPNRHLAISGALNDFSQTVVRHVVEEEHLGRVIYAGGDDVLAMLPVADLVSTMQRLRHAYSGNDPEHEGGTDKTLTLDNGFALLKTRRGGKEQLRLMRMMGKQATASCGAVIAHHQAPLGAVLRELRQAEQRAKHEGGRDAFSISVIKRSGGALRLTGKWGQPVRLLNDLIDFLREESVSRRAVYHTLEWLHDLPDPKESPALLESLLAYQLARQANGKMIKQKAPYLARRLTELTASQPKDRLKWLENFLTVGEFMARETRAGADA
jgi:CRISPR-associated protein Cmr2